MKMGYSQAKKPLTSKGSEKKRTGSGRGQVQRRACRPVAVAGVRRNDSLMYNCAVFVSCYILTVSTLGFVPR